MVFTPSRARDFAWHLLIWGALVAFSRAATAACELPPEAILFSQRIIFPDQPSVPVRVSIPVAEEILLQAQPLGVDVQLVVPELDLAADSPVRRFGARRIVISTESRISLLLTLVRKEGGGNEGAVILRIARVAALHDSACARAYRAAAAADAHYARAQSSTLAAASIPSLNSKSEYQAAASEYATARQTFLSAHSRALAALAELSVASEDYQNLQQWQDAWDAAESARVEFQSLGREYEQARALAIRAASEMELALLKPKAAAPGPAGLAQDRLAVTRLTFLKLSQLHAQRREPYDQALALNNAGLTAHYAGHYDQAIATYRQVLPLYRALREKQRQAQVLQNIALTESELGRLSLARRDYGDAIDLIDSNSTVSLRGEILNNEAVVEYGLGELDAALRHHSQALSILTRAQLEREQARSLHGIGSVYYAAGDKEQALEYLSQAVAMRDPKRDPRGRIASLRVEASVLSDLHRYAEALQLRREALELAVTPSTRVRIEAQLARDLRLAGETMEARTVINAALQEQGSSLTSRALALLTRAESELSEIALTDAEHDAQSALRLLKDSEAPHEQFAAWSLSAQIAQARGDWHTALIRIGRALQLAEQVRLESANPELRTGVWQSSRPVFDLKIETLVQAAAPDSENSSPASVRTATESPGDAGSRLASETLAVAEDSRARSLADYWRLRRAASDRTDTVTSQVESLYQEIAYRRYQLDVRRDRAGDDDPRGRVIRADIARLRREIDSRYPLARSSPTASRSSSNRPPGPSEIARQVATIPADTAVIEYWLGAHHARAWVLTNHGVRMISLGPSERLDQAARTAHTSLEDFASVSRAERAERIANLSALVIRPLPADVLAFHTLVIIPDGALHYIPFAILTEDRGDTAHTLVTDHILVTAPSLASARWRLKTLPGPKRVLLVSDPVYNDDDVRFSTARLSVGLPHDPLESNTAKANILTFRGPSPTATFARLPGTASEAAAVRGLFDPGTADNLSGFDASRATFLSRDLSQYRIIHVAAHAESDTDAPQLSALVLSLRNASGEAISGEVFAGEFLLRPLDADLVVLSACNTAIGRESAGEGLLGLRYAVHAAGARSVIASLWQVPDRPAASLMSEFYQRYIGSHESPALALAEAMRAAERTYDDPSLWGAYEISVIGPEALHTSL